jgi:hypothetical protein
MGLTTYANRQPGAAPLRCFAMRKDLAVVAAALALATSLLWLAAAPYPM